MQADLQNKLQPSQISLILIASILVTGALFVMRSVLVPFVFSIFLFFVISPFIDWQKRRIKMPKALALLSSFLVLLLVFAIFFIMIGVSIKGFVTSSGAYQLKLLNLLDAFSLYATEHGYSFDLSLLRQSLIQLPIVAWVTQISSSIVTILGNLILVFIFTLFLLMGKETDHEDEKKILDVEIQKSITRYIATKFVTSTMTAVLVGIILAAFQVQLGLMFAVLTFFLNFIPNVGSMIAVLLPLPVILLQYGGGWILVLATLLIALVQFVIGSIIDPKIMGENLGLHPAVILLSLLFWGFIWGVPGMFLSAPITAILKIFFSRTKRFQPLARLLEGHIN